MNMTDPIERERILRGYFADYLKGRKGSRFWSELLSDENPMSEIEAELRKAVTEHGKILGENEGLGTLENALFADLFALLRDFQSRYASPSRLRIAGLRDTTWSSQTRLFGLVMAKAFEEKGEEESG